SSPYVPAFPNGPTPATGPRRKRPRHDSPSTARCDVSPTAASAPSIHPSKAFHTTPTEHSQASGSLPRGSVDRSANRRRQKRSHAAGARDTPPSHPVARDKSEDASRVHSRRVDRSTAVL